MDDDTYRSNFFPLLVTTIVSQMKCVVLYVTFPPYSENAIYTLHDKMVRTTILKRRQDGGA